MKDKKNISKAARNHPNNEMPHFFEHQAICHIPIPFTICVITFIQKRRCKKAHTAPEITVKQHSTPISSTSNTALYCINRLCASLMIDQVTYCSVSPLFYSWPCTLLHSATNIANALIAFPLAFRSMTFTILLESQFFALLTYQFYLQYRQTALYPFLFYEIPQYRYKCLV